ncbi:MAG: DNA polymerase III subunit [Dehalococcoidia bacterium]
METDPGGSRLWGLIGQDAEVRTLAAGVASGNHAHAYLFSGPARAGKATLARRFAQALNCAGADAGAGVLPGADRPCGACRACRHIEAGTFPDVELVSLGGLCDESEHDHRKDNSKDIKICQVRAIERRLNFSPFEGRCRVVIIDPADALNVYAADAFLKTLEEPPPHTVLILVTAKEESLLETVRSRIRRVELRPAPVAELVAELVSRGVPPERATLIARLARGATGWALAAATDAKTLEDRDRQMDELIGLQSADRFERFEFGAVLAGRWSKDRAGVTATLAAWAEWWRDVALAAAGAERGILNVDRLPQVRSAASASSVAGAARFVQAVRDAQKQLEENASPRLALDVLMLRVPEPHGDDARAVRG